MDSSKELSELTSRIRCDLSGEDVDFEESSQVTIYRRDTKVRCQIDVTNELLYLALLKGKATKITFKPKWQQWDASKKQYVNVESK